MTSPLEAKPAPARVFVALGSNLGDRRALIAAAIGRIAGLPGTRVVAVSPVIESAPLLEPTAANGTGAEPPAGQPRPCKQGMYLNAVCELGTSLAPPVLLDHLLEIERGLGRQRVDGRRWEARTIDLDILLFGDRVIDAPGLRVPHPSMHERGFVLGPLAAIAPDAVHPVLGRTAAGLLDELGGGAAVTS